MSYDQGYAWFALGDDLQRQRVLRGFSLWGRCLKVLHCRSFLIMQAVTSVPNLFPNLEQLEVDDRVTATNATPRQAGAFRGILSAFPRLTDLEWREWQSWPTNPDIDEKTASLTSELAEDKRQWKRIVIRHWLDWKKVGFTKSLVLELANPKLTTLTFTSAEEKSDVKEAWSAADVAKLVTRLDGSVCRELAFPHAVVAGEEKEIVTLLVEHLPNLSHVSWNRELKVPEEQWLTAMDTWPGVFRDFPPSNQVALASPPLSRQGIERVVSRPRAFERIWLTVNDQDKIGFTEWTARDYDRFFRSSTVWHTIRFSSNHPWKEELQSSTLEWILTELASLDSFSLLSHSLTFAISDATLRRFASRPREELRLGQLGVPTSERKGMYTADFSKTTLALVLKNIPFCRLTTAIVSSLSVGDWLNLIQNVDLDRTWTYMDHMYIIPAAVGELLQEAATRRLLIGVRVSVMTRANASWCGLRIFYG
jgi:hypothetical protein